MRVEVWGRTGGGESQSPDNTRPPAGKAADTKGKGKAKQPDDEATSSEWRILETWDVDLRHLTALTEDVSLPHRLSHTGLVTPSQLAARPGHLPSNTLLIALSTGETFYLPPRSLGPASPARPPSPNAGYNSDPEGDYAAFLSPRPDASFDGLPLSPAMSEFDGHSRRKGAGKSANLQDILKCVGGVFEKFFY